MNLKDINKYVINKFDDLDTDDFPVEKQETYCLRWHESYNRSVFPFCDHH